MVLRSALNGRMRHRLSMGIVAALVAFQCSVAFAQVGGFGQITGRVGDPSGAVVAGARVTVTNQSTNVKKTTATNGDGYYVVNSLIPGSYDVTVTRDGFATQTRTAITLSVAQIARIDFTLRVGATTQQITVESSAALLQTESASVGAVVGHTGVVDLPLNGRNYLQLSTLAPGVIATKLSSLTSDLPLNQLVVNGIRNSGVAYMIDGADAGDEFNSSSPYTPAPDAIQEFKMDTNNMSAAYGNGGGIINAVLRSGTNQYHGDVYEFFRNTTLDSRNFFAATTPQLNQNQFGFTFGGPIKKNKTFFFVDYEGQRILNGETFDSVVPTVAERSGDYTGVKQLKNPYTGQPLTPDIIPQISPQAAFFLPYIPLPNNPAGTYIRNADMVNNFDQYDVRIDQQIRSADSLSFTDSLSQGPVDIPSNFPTSGAYNSNHRLQFATLAWTHNFGPSAINQARVTYSRQAGSAIPQGTGTNYTEEAGIGGYELTSATFPGFPTITMSGYTGIGGSNQFRPIHHWFNPFTIGDVLTIIKGNHTFEIGGDSRWWSDFVTNAGWSRGGFNFTGTYTGNSFADFLYGLPFQGRRNFPADLFGQYQSNQDAFFEDNWKLTPHLTWIAGVRYDLIHPYTAMSNEAAELNLNTNQIVVASNAAGQINTNTQQVEQYVLPLFQSIIVPSSKLGLGPSMVRADDHAFAPRMGLTYDFGHGFVVRAGYGIFYPLPNMNQYTSGRQTPPFVANEYSNFNTTPIPTKTTANIFPPLTPGNLILSDLGFWQFNPNLTDPYLQEWNFTVQKVVGKNLSLQAGYVATKGTHLNYADAVNVPQPGPGPIQARRFNTFWGEGFVYENSVDSIYNALQMTAKTRAWHGVSMLAGYTWSKSLDLGSSDLEGFCASPQNPYNLHDEWGISDFNVPSRFTVDMIWSLPFLRNRRHGLLSEVLGGWTVSNIITLQSGLPFTPIIGTNPANTGTPQRPDRIGSGILASPTINEWFNVSAFAIPAAYTYGNSARNILNGPPLHDWDFSLFKTFVLSQRHEGIRAQFRGEFFNFTNTPYFGQPETTIGTASAGQVLSAGAPREVQLVFKILF
ncbi:MAG: carboxypeptidase regulatory-like domain-containing protein [Terriglobia bacterium]